MHPSARREREIPRFNFGDNWQRFSTDLDDRQVEATLQSLQARLSRKDLRGLTFLDIGCGSGLSSLAAHRLGAEVHSFDYDPVSVQCTERLRGRYAASGNWTIERGSVLDTEYLARLGRFDIVYSFGVLHHTGALWDALAATVPLVARGGTLWIAIYNDQGLPSVLWRRLKQAYNRLPPALRPLLAYVACARIWGPTFVKDFVRTGSPLHTWGTYFKRRGMSPFIDVVDWVGGYPFEVARPEEVFAFYRSRGFILEELRTAGSGSGNNDFLFTAPAEIPTGKMNVWPTRSCRPG